jgi:hypothetical protein
LGFRGEVLSVILIAGGFEEFLLRKPVSLLSERSVIAIKGYHRWVGGAKIALSAIEVIAE